MRTVPHRHDVRPPARLRVVVVDGVDAGRSCEAKEDRPVAVGTSADNELVLADRAVSRYHVELRRSVDGVELKDLGSRNGTWLRDARVERATLPVGATVRVGKTTLRVEDAEALPADPGGSVEGVPGLVGVSASMRQAAQAVRELGPTSLSVLVQGETGTGKEVVARALHALSPRREKPFVVVDCGAMPATLIASELFGHERGAFTGADRQRVGAFERANGGTIFLDEVGELPPAVQPALLGVLERRTFRRVGGDRELEVDVRVIGATLRDIRTDANEGRLRPDLYFRMAVARVVLAPLRERPEDVAPLVRHFVRELTGTEEAGLFSEAALDALAGQRWSGNVRELRNVVETSLAMGRLAMEGGAPASGAGAPASGAAGVDLSTSYGDARALAIAQFERSYLQALIQSTEGNASEAARRAKMDRPWLLRLLRRHGLR